MGVSNITELLSSEFAMSTPSSTHTQVAIVGGGIGGLAVLLTLFRRGISAKLYERDMDLNERAHLGSMLDLGYDSGQRALRENGLEDVFKANSRLDAQELRIGGKDGVPLFRTTAEDAVTEQGARPEIDRAVLRRIMFEGVPADAVKWGHTLASIGLLQHGRRELTFTNGLVVIADMVIGADGANSHVRSLVTPAVPIYHGITGAEIAITPELAASTGMADVSKGVGLGNCFLADDGKTLFFQRNGDGRIRAFAWHHHMDPLFPVEPTEARNALLELFSDWAPWMRKFIEHFDDDAVYPRPLYYLPVGHQWEHKPGITLIGDAAHLMSPAAGAGANLAFLDGLELGIALGATISTGRRVEEREAAVAAFEQRMLARAERSATASYHNLQAFVSPASPWSTIAAWKALLATGRRET